MQTFERVMMHCIYQMHKKLTNMVCSPEKLYMSNTFLLILRWRKWENSKFFSKVVKSQIENACDKTWAAEDKINFKCCNHLLFLLELKKTMYIISLLRKKSHQSMASIEIRMRIFLKQAEKNWICLQHRLKIVVNFPDLKICRHIFFPYTNLYHIKI